MATAKHPDAEALAEKVAAETQRQLPPRVCRRSDSEA